MRNFFVGLVGTAVWLLLLSCQNPKETDQLLQNRQIDARTAQPDPGQSILNRPYDSGHNVVRELDIGIAGDDESSEHLYFNYIENNALQISLYRSQDRQQQQRIVNSLFVDIGREDYQVQSADLLENGRNEVVIIGSPRSGQGLVAYTLALTGSNNSLRLIFSISAPPGGSINLDWDAQGFYLLSSRNNQRGDEVVTSYRWSETRRRFISQQIERSSAGDEADTRMQRIHNREKDFMFSSLDGFWLWRNPSTSERSIIGFSSREKTMEIYISSKNGKIFLPNEHSLERFKINGTAFFYQARISLDISNFYLEGLRRWLSISYRSYDQISVSSSVPEPWAGEYQRMKKEDLAQLLPRLTQSENIVPRSLYGHFVGENLSLTFDEGELRLTENGVLYQGFYVFFLWQEIYILQYRAVNKEKQQEKRGLWRVEIDSTAPSTDNNRQLALIPLSTSAEVTIVRLVQEPQTSPGSEPGG